MTQIEQIRAEIERILSSFPKPRGEVLPIDQNAYNLLSDLRTFIDSILAEQPSKDLEKLIQNLTDKYPINKDSVPEQSLNDYHQGLRFGVLQGINWQKEQMLKSAIDATIISRWKDSHVCLTTKKDIPQIYNGDKVKVIIVKENEQ